MFTGEPRNSDKLSDIFIFFYGPIDWWCILKRHQSQISFRAVINRFLEHLLLKKKLKYSLDEVSVFLSDKSSIYTDVKLTSERFDDLYIECSEIVITVNELEKEPTPNQNISNALIEPFISIGEQYVKKGDFASAIYIFKSFGYQTLINLVQIYYRLNMFQEIYKLKDTLLSLFPNNQEIFKIVSAVLNHSNIENVDRDRIKECFRNRFQESFFQEDTNQDKVKKFIEGRKWVEALSWILSDPSHHKYIRNIAFCDQGYKTIENFIRKSYVSPLSIINVTVLLYKYGFRYYSLKLLHGLCLETAFSISFVPTYLYLLWFDGKNSIFLEVLSALIENNCEINGVLHMIQYRLCGSEGTCKEEPDEIDESLSGIDKIHVAALVKVIALFLYTNGHASKYNNFMKSASNYNDCLSGSALYKDIHEMSRELEKIVATRFVDIETIVIGSKNILILNDIKRLEPCCEIPVAYVPILGFSIYNILCNENEGVSQRFFEVILASDIYKSVCIEISDYDVQCIIPHLLRTCVFSTAAQAVDHMVNKYIEFVDKLIKLKSHMVFRLVVISSQCNYQDKDQGQRHLNNLFIKELRAKISRSKSLEGRVILEPWM